MMRTLNSDSATFADTGGRQVSKKPSIAFSVTKLASPMAPSTSTAEAMALLGGKKEKKRKKRGEVKMPMEG